MLPERATRLRAAAASLREAMGFPLLQTGRDAYDRRIAALREALGEPSFTAAWETGRALTWQQAVDDALADDAASALAASEGRSSLPTRAGVDFRSRVVLMAYRYDKPYAARRQSGHRNGYSVQYFSRCRLPG